MSNKFARINPALCFAILAVLACWLVFSLALHRQCREDLVKLNLLARANISSVRKLHGKSETGEQSIDSQKLKSLVASNSTQSALLRIAEQNETLMLEARRLNLQANELQEFENSRQRLNQALLEQGLDNAGNLQLTTITGGLLCALTAIGLLLSKIASTRQPLAVETPAPAGSNDQWKTLFNSLPIGIITANEVGMVRTLNPEAARILQCPTTTDEGSVSIATLLGDSDLAGLLDRSMGQPLHLATLSGKDVSIAVRTVRFKNSQGENGFLLSLLDVSKKVELDRLKAQFIAMVGHDLRAPLTSTSGFIQMLIDGLYGQLPEQAVETLCLVSDDILRVIRICNSLLDIQRLENPDYSIVVTDVPVADIFNRAVRSLGAHIQGKALTVKVQSDNACVRANEDLLLQSMINLLSNAIKFSPENSTISLAAESTAKTVRLNVIDEGPGLPPSMLEKAFQPSFRSKPSSAQSAGFGLSLVRLIVEKHKGTVSYAPNTPTGSNFTIELPKSSVPVVP